MRKHDEIDFSKGQGYLLNGVLTDGWGNPIPVPPSDSPMPARRGRRPAVVAADAGEDGAVMVTIDGTDATDDDEGDA